MTEERKVQLFSVAFENEEVAKKTLSMTPAEVVAFMAEKGFDYTEEEILEIGQELQKKADAVKNGELDEADLEDVAGGNKYTFWGGVATGVLIGGIIICGW